jgi:hypothetical protein
MNMEQLGGSELVGKTEVFTGSLLQCRCVHQKKPKWPELGSNPDRRSGKLATDCAMMLAVDIFYLCHNDDDIQ